MHSFDLNSLHDELKKHGQQHLLRFWDLLTDDQKYLLYQDVKSIKFDEILQTFHGTSKIGGEKSSIDDDLLEPLDNDIHQGIDTSTPEQLSKYRQEGLRQIAQGNVAVLLLAGGQGTRLGFQYPKGMYDVGLPSKKTLYQLQGERIYRVQQLASEYSEQPVIPWYIMTSEHTKEPTEEFFAKFNYFNLNKENIIIFEQGTLPCFTFDGKVILEKKYRVSRSPDGNGGLYKALDETGILDDMGKRGIKYVHVYCVDNILVKMADPTFIGYCVLQGAEAGAKVVEKCRPDEAVGIICKVNGKFKVVEYSEISKTIAERRDENNKLTFRAGSICNHFFTVDFLKRVTKMASLPHHLAHKKIPFISENGDEIIPDKPNGIKLEKFVFDVFEFTDKFTVWQVLRDHEFAPLKNGPGTSGDNPTTARHAIYRLHRHYLESAGIKLTRQKEKLTVFFVSPEKPMSIASSRRLSDLLASETVDICEISPLVSHEGEKLEHISNEKQFEMPLLISSSIEVERSLDVNDRLWINKH